MNHRRASAIGLWLPLLAATALLSFAAGQLTAAEAGAAPAWELWPYRVHVLVAMEPGNRLPQRFADELPEFLKDRAATVFGGAWRLEVSFAPVDRRHQIVHDMPSVTEESLPAAARKSDKVILLGIGASADGFQIHAREFDVVTGLWNATIVLDVKQDSYLRHEAFRAVLAAFAPLARIEKVEREVVTLRLRAGALARRDGPLPLASGAVFRPVLVESNAQGAVAPGKAEPIDWTYLTATETTDGLVKCRLHTGLRAPAIPDFHPLRQRWAIGISPPTAETRLRLVSRGSEPKPLEGLEVLAEDSSPAAGATRSVAIGRSDRRGEVLVPAGPRTVRTVVVRQGEEILARFPIVPGVVEELTLPLSFDPARLQIESALTRIADDLVDAAARREVLTVRIRAAEQAGKSEEAASLREQSRQTAGADALLARLDKLQQSVQSASAPTKQLLGPKLAELRKSIEQLQAAPATK